MKDCIFHYVFSFPNRDYSVFSLAHRVSTLSSSFPSIWNTGLLGWKMAVVEMWAMFWSFLSSLDTKIETMSQAELWRVVHHSKLHWIPSSGQQGKHFSTELLALFSAWAHFCELVHSRTSQTRLHQMHLLLSYTIFQCYPSRFYTLRHVIHICSFMLQSHHSGKLQHRLYITSDILNWEKATWKEAFSIGPHRHHMGWDKSQG